MTTILTVGHDEHGVFISITVNGKEIKPPARPNPKDASDLFHDVIHAVLAVARSSGISPVLGSLAYEHAQTSSHHLRNLEEDAVLAIGKYLSYRTEEEDG